MYTLGGPVVSIGGSDDRPEYQLQYTIGALRLSNGDVVIADTGPNELRYFDAQGRHLRTPGREGGGPGEFRNLWAIARIRGDTIVAWDSRQRRLSVFTSNGRLVSSVVLDWAATLERLQAQYPDRTISFGTLHVLENGMIVVESSPNRNPLMTSGVQVIQDTVPILVFDRTGEQARTLGHFAGDEFFYRNRVASLLQFGERLHVAAGKDLAWVGSTHDRVIRGVSMTGAVLRTISLPFERRAITRADVPEPGTGRIAEHFAAMPLPDSMPLLSGLRYGAGGRLWVQKYVAPNDVSQEWLAFDEDGNHVASLRMDTSAELLDIGDDYAVVLVTDELDVQAVRVHGLRSAPR